VSLFYRDPLFGGLLPESLDYGIFKALTSNCAVISDIIQGHASFTQLFTPERVREAGQSHPSEQPTVDGIAGFGGF